MDTNLYRNEMSKTMSHLEKEFSQLQLGRASTNLIEAINVFIPSWNMTQKLNQVASTSIIDSQTIKVEPWDKSVLSSIEKAIYESGTGLTPVNHGGHILIKVPQLTQERRKDLTKLVSKIGEDSKVTIRNTRHEAMKEIKKEFDEKMISEDEKKSLEKKIDDMTKEFSNNIDSKVKSKSDEIMKI